MQCVTHSEPCGLQMRDCKPGRSLRLGELCTWHPAAGRVIGHPCPVCGHSDLVHIGTEHCPVCELVYQATPQYRREQERIHGYSHPLGQRRF
jgi:hypothetical protein